ncbi:glycosyltransferase family 2 protein [Candidatus Saccharibacteria bacterium]|nr:glycosyltransferase family 2 protein [Candidatus Saccharibacteria bacterium]
MSSPDPSLVGPPEIPIGKRKLLYRLFEILPATMSYGAIILLVVLSIFQPTWAAFFMLLITSIVFIRVIRMGSHLFLAYRNLQANRRIDWHKWLHELDDAEKSLEKRRANGGQKSALVKQHEENLRLIAAEREHYPLASAVYHGVIIAAFDEEYDIIAPTVESIISSGVDCSKVVITLAYEERGGKAIAETAAKLQKKYGNKVRDFLTVMHPKDLPDEVVGKGPNISYAGVKVAEYFDKAKVPADRVIITTLDSDNRPSKDYFDRVAYEFISREDRDRCSFQPVSLFLNNVWDAPAPMRVVAAGNTFWSLASQMRPHLTRNFASHSQPLSALKAMNFWTKRSIVEDGHQYWRSYFFFNGDYRAVPVGISIGQDIVQGPTLRASLKAQWKQLRRWFYGASDVAYVGANLFSRNRKAPFFKTFWNLGVLLGETRTLATYPLLIAFGGFVPLFLNQTVRLDPVVQQLPIIISTVQQLALVGIIILIVMSLRMLPSRPRHRTKWKFVGFVAQWVLVPFVAIGYTSATAFYSQTRLALGFYMDKFDVTVKHRTKAPKK